MKANYRGCCGITKDPNEGDCMLIFQYYVLNNNLSETFGEITSRKYNKSAGIKDSFNIVKMSQLRFRTNRIESNFKVIRFDSIRSSFNSIRFKLKKTGFESIRILKKNFNVIFVSFKFQYNKKFKLILYYYYSDDQTDE